MAAIATGLLAGHGPGRGRSPSFGKAFNDNRIIAVVWIVLPVIGLLERYGLQQRARGGDRAASGPRRSGGCSSSICSTARPSRRSASTRPPAIRRRSGRWSRRWRSPRPRSRHGALDEATTEKVKAYAAATDNVGLFFGEDIFFAIGSIVLIQQTLEAYGISLSPLELAVWAIPTAIAAFIIHSTRLLLLDRTCLPAAKRRGGGPPEGWWRGN